MCPYVQLSPKGVDTQIEITNKYVMTFTMCENTEGHLMSDGVPTKHPLNKHLRREKKRRKCIKWFPINREGVFARTSVRSPGSESSTAWSCSSDVLQRTSSSRWTTCLPRLLILVHNCQGTFLNNECVFWLCVRASHRAVRPHMFLFICLPSFPEQSFLAKIKTEQLWIENWIKGLEVFIMFLEKSTNF